MGQYWLLTNLDSEEAINGGKLGEFFCNHATFVDIVDFTVPAWSEDRLALLYRKHPRTAHKSKSPASRLLHLSDELISMILEYMDDLVDAACFCLADGRLLSIGFSRVGELQKLKFAPWAGDRVVCLGDYTDDNDYPSSLQEHVDEWLGNEDGSSCSEDGESRAFLEMILERFERRRDRPSKYSYLYRDGRMETSDFTALSTLADPEYKSSNPWVLCNLSKHEYVRADAIAGITEGEVKKSMPFLYGPISLGQALLSRICWSSDGSISMCYEGDLHRGPWAGDRFEVTTTDKLQGNEWKDISAEVAELLPKIWDAEYGDDSWRKE